MKPGRTGVFVASKIPTLMKQPILDSINMGRYISISDFIRSAIKEKLDRDYHGWNLNLNGGKKDD